MTPSAAAGSIAIAALAAASVGLWTARVALASSGRRLGAAGVASIEAVMFLLVFQQLAANVQAIDRLVAYAVGVAAGTYIGLYANERLSAGQSSVHAILAGRRPGLGSALHDLGWPSTTDEGCGLAGPVTTALIVVDDRLLGAVLGDLHRIAPDAFVTVHQLRRVQPVRLPGGLRQVKTGRIARRDRTPISPAEARP